MMAKIGYKAGEGLGREHQGIATSLGVEKTSVRGGKIVLQSGHSGTEPTSSVIPTRMRNLFNSCLGFGRL